MRTRLKREGLSAVSNFSDIICWLIVCPVGQAVSKTPSSQGRSDDEIRELAGSESQNMGFQAQRHQCNKAGKTPGPIQCQLFFACDVMSIVSGALSTPRRLVRKTFWYGKPTWPGQH